MQRTQRIIQLLFWLTTGSLVVFCFLFGFPVISQFASRKVIAFAGCSPPSFDIQAVCPPGSFAEPFVPLSHWLTSFLAPIVLVTNFGGILLIWACVCFVLFGTSCALRDKNTP